MPVCSTHPACARLCGEQISILRTAYFPSKWLTALAVTGCPNLLFVLNAGNDCYYRITDWGRVSFGLLNHRDALDQSGGHHEQVSASTVYTWPTCRRKGKTTMSARAEVQEVSYMKASLHATASRFGHWRVIGALAASNITPLFRSTPPRATCGLKKKGGDIYALKMFKLRHSSSFGEITCLYY